MENLKSSSRPKSVTPNAHGEIVVKPRRSLVEEKIDISLKGLSPGQPITLTAILIGDSKERFESYGHFVANEAGNVYVAEDACLFGTYTGIDPMGLLWSMQPSPGQRKGLRLSKKDVTKPYFVQLQLFDGHVEDVDTLEDLQPITSVTFEKWYMTDGVRRIPVRDGRLRGTLFLPPGKGPFPGVIDLFGTAGGLIEFKASLLASRGFAALALAYFAFEDLPIVPTEMELEYFFEACDWMLAHADVMSRGLGLMGVSKGSEMALTVAAHRKEIAAVVAISPAHAIVGFPLKYKGKPMDFLKFEPDLVKLSKNGALILQESYPLDATDAPGNNATIKVENIQGDILLICGADDQSWESEKMVGKICSRLRKHGKESCCTVRCYPGTGHLIEPPYMPPCHTSYHKTYRMTVEWGGQPREQALAQEDSWQSILKFLSTKLAAANLTSRL